MTGNGNILGDIEHRPRKINVTWFFLLLLFCRDSHLWMLALIFR